MGQCRDIVDDPRASRERCFHDGLVPGVDRHDRAALGERAHDRLDAPDLFAGRQLGSAGTRQLAADVDDVGAGGDERAAMRDSALGIEPAPAVRKAVRASH